MSKVRRNIHLVSGGLAVQFQVKEQCHKAYTVSAQTANAS